MRTANHHARAGEDLSAEKLARATVTLGVGTDEFAKHVKWAKAVARGVRQHYRFLTGSQEEQDLEGVALVQLWRLAGEFDPNRVPEGGSFYGAFHGWAHPFIRGECQRHCRRLRNGGTYNTRKETGRLPVLVEELPRRRGDHGDEYVDLADREPAEEREPVPCGVEYVTDPDEWV